MTSTAASAEASRIRLFFVIGMTNVGKTTFMSCARRFPRVRTIEVGKVLRAKYPPGHFDGQDAPAHTADEAWQIVSDGVREASEAGVLNIFCDGQPRDLSHVPLCVDMDADFEVHFLCLYADRLVRILRAIARDGAGVSSALKDQLVSTMGLPAFPVAEIPSALNLSLQRITRDYTSCYEVVAQLSLLGWAPDWLDTTGLATYEPFIEKLLSCPPERPVVLPNNPIPGAFTGTTFRKGKEAEAAAFAGPTGNVTSGPGGRLHAMRPNPPTP